MRSPENNITSGKGTTAAVAVPFLLQKKHKKAWQNRGKAAKQNNRFCEKKRKGLRVGEPEL
jgi:hypothetical protein